MTRASDLGGELRRTGQQARRAWAFLDRAQRMMLGGALLAMLGVGYLAAQVPVLLGRLVDALGRGGIDLAGANPYIQTVTLLLGAVVILRVARHLLVERAATTLERNAVVAGSRALLQAPLERLGARGDAAIGGNLTRGVAGIVKLVKLCFLDALPALTGAAFALAAAMQKHLLLGFAMAAVVPISCCLVLWQMASQHGVRVALLDLREALDGLFGEQLGGIEAIRAAHMLEPEVGRIAVQADAMRQRGFSHHRAMAAFDAGKNALEGIAYVSVIGFAVSLCLAGEITAGDILAFSLLYLGVLNPLREIHRILDEAHESGLRAERFFAILDAPPDPSFLAPGSTAVDLTAPVMIEIDGLGLDYMLPGAAPVVALDRVALAVPRGELLGLAGASGAGKSSLIRVLLRLVPPTRGTVRIAGADLADLSRAQIAQLIGYVGQRPFLFSGTIAQNIAFGANGATHAQIVAAARQANIHPEIMRLPGGYDHRVSQRGENLSGGQAQRIALARIFLRQPPILILDEATAALDNRNERAVMDALARAVAGRTVLMIAHRLSTLERATRIIVFADGRIAEAGDYASLAARPDGVLAGLLRAARAPSELIDA